MEYALLDEDSNDLKNIPYERKNSNLKTKQTTTKESAENFRKKYFKNNN